MKVGESRVPLCRAVASGKLHVKLLSVYVISGHCFEISQSLEPRYHSGFIFQAVGCILATFVFFKGFTNLPSPQKVLPDHNCIIASLMSVQCCSHRFTNCLLCDL